MSKKSDCAHARATSPPKNANLPRLPRVEYLAGGQVRYRVRRKNMSFVACPLAHSLVHPFYEEPSCDVSSPRDRVGRSQSVGRAMKRDLRSACPNRRDSILPFLRRPLGRGKVQFVSYYCQGRGRAKDDATDVATKGLCHRNGAARTYSVIRTHGGCGGIHANLS